MKLATDIGGTFTDLVYLDQATGKPGLLVESNAGSWGEPADRDKDAVRTNLRAGVINLEAAGDVSSLTDEKV